jgi:hypothetical protein
MKSRLMIEKTLLLPVTVNKTQISLADYYVDINHLRDLWKKKDKALENIHFAVGKDRLSFSRKEDSILNVIYQDIVDKRLFIDKPNKKSGFILVKCTSVDEVFSKSFIESLVREATKFYVQSKVKRSKANVDVLQAKADSIEQLLNKKTYSAALSADLNLNPARRVASVGTELVSRDKTMLQTIYGEVIKNLELSKMTMAQETPIIQIIDSPIMPLEKQHFGKLKGILIGGFISAFLAIFYLILRKIYVDILAS